jgi:hypothetical protein
VVSAALTFHDFKAQIKLRLFKRADVDKVRASMDRLHEYLGV